jgi:hypothetical protein
LIHNIDPRWGLSTAVLVMLAFMSYLTTTFMIESMASANAMLNVKRSQGPILQNSFVGHV